MAENLRKKWSPLKEDQFSFDLYCLIFFLGRELQTLVQIVYIMYVNALKVESEFYGTQDREERVQYLSTFTPFSIREEECPGNLTYLGNNTYDWLQIQSMVSTDSHLLVLCENLPAVVILFTFATLSDAIGRRKFIIWIPALGSVVHAVCFIIDAYIGNQNLKLVYLGSFIDGVCGSQLLFYVGMGSYVSDMLPVKGRTNKLLVLEFWILLMRAFSIFIFKIVYNLSGFDIVIWITFIITTLGFVLIFNLLGESIPNTDLHLQGHNGFYIYTNTISRCGCNRKPWLKKKLWLIIFVYFIYNTIYTSQEESILLINAAYPLCFDYLKNGLYFGLSAAGCAVTCLMTMFVLKGNTFLQEEWFVLFGFISVILGDIVYAFSSKVWIAAIAYCLMLFKAVPNPIQRSLAAKLFGEGHQATVYALVQCAHAISNSMGTIIYTFFKNEWSPGGIKIWFPFLLSPLILVIPIVIYVYFLRTNRLVEAVMLSNNIFVPAIQEPVKQLANQDPSNNVKTRHHNYSCHSSFEESVEFQHHSHLSQSSSSLQNFSQSSSSSTSHDQVKRWDP